MLSTGRRCISKHFSLQPNSISRRFRRFLCIGDMFFSIEQHSNSRAPRASPRGERTPLRILYRTSATFSARLRARSFSKKWGSERADRVPTTKERSVCRTIVEFPARYLLGVFVLEF